MLLLWLLLAIKAGFIGMAILIQHAMPEFIARAGEQYQRKPRRFASLLGLINGVGIPFVAILLISTEALALAGLLLLVFYLWLALLSYTVMYRSIGSKLFDDFGPNREVKVTLYGGLIAEAAFFTPVLGQVCSLVLFVRGLGAVTISILGRGRGG
jgi:hypothetical protein